MAAHLTDLEYQALLKVQQRVFHCKSWEQYLQIHHPDASEDFTRLFDLLCLATKEDTLVVKNILNLRFKQIALITSIEYVKQKLEGIGAPVDLQVLPRSRMLEYNHSTLDYINWQRPLRANTTAVKTHKWVRNSVITSILNLESNLQLRSKTAVNFVSTEKYFAISWATQESAYIYEPWLSWFVYFQATDLNELQTWMGYRESVINLLKTSREQATMLFELQIQTLSLIWPKAVPIPDLTALTAAAVEA